MVESLACGTPVVACPRGAAPEIVRDAVNGYLADSDDDLVTAIGAVGGIDRASCRRWVEEHFSVERMTAGYLAAFEKRVAR